MSRVILILVREYLENVRTKAFLIGVVLTPLWFGLVFVVPQLAKEQESARQPVGILDLTGQLAPDLKDRIVERKTARGAPAFEVTVEDADQAFTPGAAGTTPFDRLRTQVAEGDLVLVVVTPSVLEKRPTHDGERPGGIFHAASVAGSAAAHQLLEVLNAAVNRRIMKARDIDPKDAELLARDATKPVGLTRTGKASSVFEFVMPFVFMFFLFMGIVGVSQMLVNSTIEEKASRVFEILLSSVSPFELMAGKVLGICAVGFTLLGLWIGGGLLAAEIQGVGGIVTGGQIGLFVAYYVLGYLLIASLMVAVGSACNTLKEAQNLMAPISILLALPLLIAMVVLKDPNGTLATVASFIPPFTPFLMMARAAVVPGPPAWQVPASLALLAVSTVFAVRLAGRIFRTGILMYGKPPRLGEILRWVREP